MVWAVARDLAGRTGYPLDDCVGAGMVGLAEAAQRWQPGHGANFKSYARHRVAGAILDEIRRMTFGVQKPAPGQRRPTVSSIDDGRRWLPPLTDRCDVAEQATGRALWAAAVRLLGPRDRWVLWQTIGLGRTLADVGRDLGVTEAAVSLRRTHALKVLRERITPPSPKQE